MNYIACQQLLNEKVSKKALTFFSFFMLNKKVSKTAKNFFFLRFQTYKANAPYNKPLK